MLTVRRWAHQTGEGCDCSVHTPSNLSMIKCLCCDYPKLACSGSSAKRIRCCGLRLPKEILNAQFKKQN